jgi:hypothetical protein
MMKKQLGIVRSRADRLAALKKEAQRKKNRFHMVGKEEEDANSKLTVMQLFLSPPPTPTPTAAMSSRSMRMSQPAL